MSLSTIDIAWLAGWLEGEGSFIISTNRGIKITAVNSDFDVITKAGRLLSGRVSAYNNPQGLGQKPLWAVYVGGIKAAGWMMTLYVLMGSRRQAKIREALGVFRTNSRSFNWYNHDDTCLCKRCRNKHRMRRYAFRKKAALEAPVHA